MRRGTVKRSDAGPPSPCRPGPNGEWDWDCKPNENKKRVIGPTRWGESGNRPVTHMARVESILYFFLFFAKSPVSAKNYNGQPIRVLWRLCEYSY